MKTNTTEVKTPKAASDEYLEEMAQFVNATYGAKKALADALSARTGEDVARERIERWLHSDNNRYSVRLCSCGKSFLK
jgi:hypothetical protein